AVSRDARTRADTHGRALRWEARLDLRRAEDRGPHHVEDTTRGRVWGRRSLWDTRATRPAPVAPATGVESWGHTTGEARMQDDIRAEAAQYYDANPTIPDDLAF